jgi:hypothetical protein
MMAILKHLISLDWFSCKRENTKSVSTSKHFKADVVAYRDSKELRFLSFVTVNMNTLLSTT